MCCSHQTQPSLTLPPSSSSSSCSSCSLCVCTIYHTAEDTQKDQLYIPSDVTERMKQYYNQGNTIQQDWELLEEAWHELKKSHAGLVPWIRSHCRHSWKFGHWMEYLRVKRRSGTFRRKTLKDTSWIGCQSFGIVCGCIHKNPNTVDSVHEAVSISSLWYQSHVSPYHCPHSHCASTLDDDATPQTVHLERTVTDISLSPLGTFKYHPVPPPCYDFVEWDTFIRMQSEGYSWWKWEGFNHKPNGWTASRRSSSRLKRQQNMDGVTSNHTNWWMMTSTCHLEPLFATKQECPCQCWQIGE